jgi:hypothetical protein
MLVRKPENETVWRRLNIARNELRLRACYCSVFDECWVSSLATTRAERVAACPAPAVPFTLAPLRADDAAMPTGADQAPQASPRR